MNTDTLREYLLKVAKEGYATNDEKAWKKEADGSTTIIHNDKQWSMHDNFFGGEPYGGREVISFEGKAVWIMVYYGKVMPEVNEIKKVYSFLQKALGQTDKDYPLRGPKLLEEENLRYENKWHGDLKEFSGEEKILEDGKDVYCAWYRGGLVDVRGEN